jgi:phage baseplate assembly protein W
MATLFRGYSTYGKRHGPFTLKDYDLAKQDITNHFYTRKGERLMNPNFGSIIWNLLFEPLDEGVIDTIKEDCQRIINLDPRFELDETRTFEHEHSLSVQLRLRYVPANKLEVLELTFDKQIEEAV